MTETCDGCPAAAAARVCLRSGQQLLLCGHHGRRFEKTLRAQGAIILGDLSWDSPAREPALA